jgi:hypothetical protein
MPFVNTIRRHHRAHHNMGIMMHVNMNLTLPGRDWAMSTSDLQRGPHSGTSSNGYSDTHLKAELKPVIARFRTSETQDQRLHARRPEPQRRRASHTFAGDQPRLNSLCLARVRDFFGSTATARLC